TYSMTHDLPLEAAQGRRHLRLWPKAVETGSAPHPTSPAPSGPSTVPTGQYIDLGFHLSSRRGHARADKAPRIPAHRILSASSEPGRVGSADGAPIDPVPAFASVL